MTWAKFNRRRRRKLTRKARAPILATPGAIRAGAWQP